MAKLKKINKDIQRKFIIGFLMLIVVFALFFWFFQTEQRRTIAEHHIGYMERADATIATLLGQARLNSYITAQEIALLLRGIEKEEIEKRELLQHLTAIELREEAAGILLAQHILLVVDMEGGILARSEWIRKERVELPQEGYIKDNWTPSLGFEQAFARALGDPDANIEPMADVRKIIYDRDFMRREGYYVAGCPFFSLPGMGLTVMTPIIDGETREQKGVLISITFVNANVAVVGGIKAVTGVSFTAILPTGEVIGSFFDMDSIRKIEERSLSPELLAIAGERKRAIVAGELEWTTENFILEDFTIEEIKLTRHDGTTTYYRVIYWLELDSKYYKNFASLRGIAMEIDVYRAQTASLIQLILVITVFLLIIFGLFYLLIQKKLIKPITSFTDQLRGERESKKIEILKSYQEHQELEDAFSLSFDQAREAQVILEIKVKARTRQLNELSASLKKQVKKKTKELQARVNELEKFKDVVVGRETKMIELKENIRKLEEEIKELKKKEK